MHNLFSDLQRLREEKGEKKGVEGVYEDVKELADRQEVRFSDENYTRHIVGGVPNLAPTKQDITELPDGLHKAKLKQEQPPQGRNKGMECKIHCKLHSSPPTCRYCSFPYFRVRKFGTVQPWPDKISYERRCRRLSTEAQN